MDVAILGAGLVGCAIARELAQYDLRVLVVEQAGAPVSETGHAPIEFVLAGHHSKAGTLRGELELEGNLRWGQLADALGLELRRTGELVLAMSTDDLFVLGDLVRQAQERDMKGVDMWTGARVRSETPGISDRVLSALHAPSTGQIDPLRAHEALAQSAQENGVRFVLGRTITSLEHEDGEWIVETSQGHLRAAFLINAAGLDADRLAGLAGTRTFSLRARTTREYLVDAAAGPVRRVLFPCSYPHAHGAFIAPADHGAVWIGPMVYEVGTGDDLGTTEPDSDHVLAEARRLLPGLPSTDTPRHFTRVRAVADSDDMHVGATGTAGLLNAVGLQASALTAAPAIAARLARVLRDEGVELRPRTAFVSRR